MKQFFTKLSFVCGLATCLAMPALAQTQPANDTMGEKQTFKPNGKLWGYAFGDYAVKAHADSLNRGGSNQYTGVKEGNDMFQLRRVYLGYNYDIAPKFSAEFLLAAEDNETTTVGTPGTSGDLLSDNKLSLYIKLANLRWKNIYPGADLVIGEVSTPAFPLLSEVVWGYRSVERTVADIRRTPSFDLGATIQGRFIPSNDNYGYDLMVGNGQSAKPENDQFKWFYGDVYAKFFNKHLIVDLYQDYEKLNWTPTWHHDRRMTKLYVAYTAPKVTVGVEAFTNTLMGDLKATGSDKKSYYFTTQAWAVSAYVRGRIYKDKLGFFARYDTYDPSGNIDAVSNTAMFTSYQALTSQYEPSTKENFITAGLDWTPMKNVHIMPNIWYDHYTNAGPAHYTDNAANNYDLAYRITFYYIYGK